MTRPWNTSSTHPPRNPKKERKPFSGASRHAYNDVYNTRRWQAIRKAFLIKNPLCKLCKQKGNIKAASIVDHVKAIQDGGDPWSWENFQSLCKRHHAIKTNQEINERKKNK